MARGENQRDSSATSLPSHALKALIFAFVAYIAEPISTEAFHAHQLLMGEGDDALPGSQTSFLPEGSAIEIQTLYTHRRRKVNPRHRLAGYLSGVVTPVEGA